MSSRDNYISTAKGIGIILMVVGHTIESNFFCRFIYMFHMPLFFFCSGYFFEVPDSWYNCGQFVKRRIKGLYYPFVRWSIIFLLLHNFFNYIHFYPADNDYYSYYNLSDYFCRMKSILITMTGQDKLLDPFWFLKELLLASILVCLLSTIVRKVTCKYVKILLWIVLIALTVVTKPGELGLPVIWNLSIMFLSATFYYSGYIYREKENNCYYSLTGLFLCMAIVFSVVLILNSSLDMLWYNAYSVLLYIPTALVGVFMIISLSYLIDSYSIRRFFYYIGKNTMIIFTLHLLAFKLVSAIILFVFDFPMCYLGDTYVKENNHYFWLLYVVAGICLPLLFQKYCGFAYGKIVCKMCKRKCS